MTAARFMFPGVSARLRRSLSWSVFIVASVSYLCLGWAEQGASGSAMLEPPSSPLPFERQAVFGLDLRQHSSLSAHQWLTGAGPLTPALIVIPVDADVVLALQESEIVEAALAATDSLVAVGAGTPLAMCLRYPDTGGDLEAIAGIAVESLIERYPDAIAYVFACEPDVNPQWQEAIAGFMADTNPRIGNVTATLLPVSAGAPVTLIDTDDPSDVGGLAESEGGANGYTVMSLFVEAPLTTDLIVDAQQAVGEAAHIGLVLLRPATTIDPAVVAAALLAGPIQPAEMLEGFTNASSSTIGRQGDWQPARVGTVEYLRTTADSSALGGEFVGTDLYLLGVRSPDAGRVHIWVDPPTMGDAPAPDVTLDLSAEQAQDIAYPLFTGLSASRHRLVLVVENSEGSNVMISGFFVSGQSTPVWTGALAAVGLLSLAIVALTDRCLASIVAIRESSGPRVANEREHPRGFNRRG